MKQTLLLLGLVVAGFLLGRLVAPPTDADVAPPPSLQLDLVSHEGVAVDGSLFGGHVSLVFFGYTHCPDICPATLARMRMVKEALGEDAARFQGIFITVDPARDTHERLKSYVTHFDPSFIGLTGTDDAIAAAALAMGAVYRRGDDVPGGYLVDHTAFGHVVTADGNMARLFPHDAGVDDMADGIRALLQGAGS